jgi:hypothetical protein
MAWPRKYTFPREVGETVVIAADSRKALRKAAHAAYHIGYRRGHLLRCKRLKERMAVEIKRVV